MAYGNKYLLRQGDEAGFNAPRPMTYDGTADSGSNDATPANIGAFKAFLQPSTTSAAKESVRDKIGKPGAVIDFYGNDSKFTRLFVKPDGDLTAAAGGGIDAAIVSATVTAA